MLAAATQGGYGPNASSAMAAQYLTTDPDAFMPAGLYVKANDEWKKA